MTVLRSAPLVSIVTPVYNGARYLDELIQSILQQDYTPIEHIIIDDGSTDDGATVEVLKRYPHLRWWSRENRGQYATMNEGLAAATGEFVGFISADDMYIIPSTISTVVEYWQAHPDCAYVYGRTTRVDAYGSPLAVQIDTTGPFPRWFLRYHLFIQHCSLFVSREIVLKDGVWFDPTLRNAGDWDWIIRLAQKDRRFGYVDQPLAQFRQHPGQTTQAVRLEAQLDEHRLVCERYGTNYRIVMLLRRLLACRSVALKGVWALRSGGVYRLRNVVRDWLARNV